MKPVIRNYTVAFLLTALLSSLAMPTIAYGQDEAETTWSPRPFSYRKTRQLYIRENTQEIDNRIPDSRQTRFWFKDARRDNVSVLVSLPEDRGPFPVVILVHGFSSYADHVTRQFGAELIEQGFATIALDLPMHNQREGVPKDMFVADLAKVLDNVKHSVIDIRQTIDFAESQISLDTSRGVFLLGYSSGAWYTTLAGVADSRVKAMVLAAAGSAVIDNPKRREHNQGVLQKYPGIRPEEAISSFAPRPLLMVNGKHDPLVTERQIRKLFSAAQAPKELRWHDLGHVLPAESKNDIAQWLSRRWKDIERGDRLSSQSQPAQ